MQNDIIIINYAFNENKVGGNRWRNLSKHLCHNGYRIFALCYKSDQKKEIDHPNLTTVSFGHWLIGLKIKKHLPLHGLIYRAIHFISKRLYAGNFFDLSYLIGKKQLRWIHNEISNERINKQCTVICSVGPFAYVEQILKLKQKHPTIKIIIDYRDPWSGNTLAFGFKHLDLKRQNIEQNKEKNALSKVDGIIGVSEDIFIKHLQNIEIETPFCEIPNGIAKITSNHNSIAKGDPIKIFLAGSLYEDLDDLLLPLKENIKQLNSIHKALIDRFEWHWIGFYNNHQIELIKSVFGTNVYFHGRINQDELGLFMQKFHLGLNIVHRDFAYSRNTKFYEILGQSKKMFLLGWPGKTSQFLIENDLGYFWNPDLSLLNVLKKIENDFDSNALSFQSGQFQTIQKLTFEIQSKRLTQFIDSIANA